MKIATLVASVVVAASAAGSALAADPTLPPPPVNTWDGAFVGVHVGYGWGDTELTNSSPPGPPTRTVQIDQDGFLGGVQVGYNHQMNNMVFGIIADISAGDFGGAFVNVPPPGPPFTATADIDWIATLRPRLGVLVQPQTLLYAHGGLALAGIEGTWVGGPWNGSVSETKAGWTAGVGVEHMFSDRLSGFLEYGYMDFGSVTFANTGGPAVNFTQDINLHAIKVGLNYHF